MTEYNYFLLMTFDARIFREQSFRISCETYCLSMEFGKVFSLKRSAVETENVNEIK